MLLIVGFGILLALLFRLWWTLCDGWALFDHSIPSPPEADVLFGHGRVVNPMYGEASVRWFQSWAARFPRLIKFRVFYFFSIATAHPDTVRAVLKDRGRKSFAYRLVRHWTGDGLLVSEGAKWHMRRKLLTPSFHFEILKSYTNIFNEATDVFVEQIRKAGGEPVDVYSKCLFLTLDTITRCLLGYDTHCQTQHNEYVKIVNRLTTLTIERCYEPLKYYLWTYRCTAEGREYMALRKRFKELGREIIEKRLKKLEEDKGCVTANFLDNLLSLEYEDGSSFSVEEVQEELNIVLFAGHDTTASALAWTLHLLSLHPEHVLQCREEVVRVLGEGRGDLLFMSQQEAGRMEYLSMCIKESLRLRPPVPYLGRNPANDIIVGKHRIPAGSNVTIMVDALHRLGEVWEAPEEFRPERFSKENSINRNHFSYIPFGAESRNCIGKNFALTEMKMALAKVLYNFNFETVDPDSVTRLAAITQKPENLLMTFSKI